MVFFSLFMWWAYSPDEYLIVGAKKTSIWRPLWDSVNYSEHRHFHNYPNKFSDLVFQPTSF